MPSFEHELNLLPKYKYIAGVDEVGRGSLAGPIVAAAVVFDDYSKLENELKDVNDSKKLTSKKREKLDLLIREKAKDIGIGEVDVIEIDAVGIGVANIMAFERALKNLKRCDFALIDGRKFRGFSYKFSCLEKGESKSLSIAAASIIAKVYRDNLMIDLAKSMNKYDFVNNKGYGSKSHFADIDKYGLSVHHRKSFLRKYFDSQKYLI